MAARRRPEEPSATRQCIIGRSMSSMKMRAKKLR
jgi:hypothetical protein